MVSYFKCQGRIDRTNFYLIRGKWDRGSLLTQTYLTGRLRPSREPTFGKPVCAGSRPGPKGPSAVSGDFRFVDTQEGYFRLISHDHWLGYRICNWLGESSSTEDRTDWGNIIPDHLGWPFWTTGVMKRRPHQVVRVNRTKGRTGVITRTYRTLSRGHHPIHPFWRMGTCFFILIFLICMSNSN